MLLQDTHDWLGWPQPHQILEPRGAGPKVYAEFAKTKIEEALKRKFPGLTIETGILVPNSDSANTVAPLAVVCQFPSGARMDQLDEAHRLAWNFSRTALLVTLEPHRLIAWSCFRDPLQADERIVCELPTPTVFKPDGTPQQRSIRDLLHWISLVTGHIQRKKPEKFPSDGRADALLLKNLKDVRRRLLNMKLEQSFCHDLLARVIFTQYLFHRRDSEGNAYFSPSLLQRRCDGALQSVHEDFGSILQDKEETYALFRWLDNRFNGDLFPGKDEQSEEEREAAWQTEKDAVHPEHLKELANLVSGKTDTTDRQLLLWPQYSFDTIPLEFISSVYEEFLNENRYRNRAFYTPSHLVDYTLDAVLPWDGEEWNLSILDPCCGSGIFLVKAFQRLIFRWRRVHGRPPLVSDLKPILANNLMGVDINAEAVRVASFSLYLTMADAIEPKHYVTREKVFPKLRGTRLITKDFFDETTLGFRTEEDAGFFDLVIGNAPWGDKSIKRTSDIIVFETAGKRKTKTQRMTKAELWAKTYEWDVANIDIGPFFLIKALALVEDAGRVAMIQPAPVWLGHRAKPARNLRRKFFSSFTTEEITNLSAIRREIFNGAIGPACVIVAGRQRPTPLSEISFFAPKPSYKQRKNSKSGNRAVTHLAIDPYDFSRIPNTSAIKDSLAWTVLTLGGPRDLRLIARLQKFDTIQLLESAQILATRNGVIPGNKKKPLGDELGNLPYFDAPKFPPDVFIELDASRIAPWGDPRIDGKGSTDFEPFKLPQLLIKQSYSVVEARFRAALVHSNLPPWGTICKETYLTVHDNAEDASHIQKACLVYNSRFATYFLALTSTRILFNTEVLNEELTAVPLPEGDVDLSEVKTFPEVDRLVEKLFSLTAAERTLIEDLLEITLPDVLRQSPGLARAPTTRRARSNVTEPELTDYARTIFRVLKSTFGGDKAVAATIYQEPDGQHLPVRVLTLHFDWPGREPLTVERLEADGLLDKLADFHRDILKRKARAANGEGLGFQRVAFLFHSHQTEHGRVRNLTIIKPDECRYWTRSLAMRDADDLAAAIFKAAGWKGAFFMTRRTTFSELAFAGDTQDPNLPVEWARGVAIQILNWIWKAFDRLRSRYLQGIDLTQPLDQLERDLARNHFIDLQAVFLEEANGFSSIYPSPEWPEMETLSSSQAKPPANDFAFVHYEHRRWAWPIEAKVLPTPRTLHDYLTDVEKFESGIAAPLVGEGAMIGYLLSGTAAVFFANLQAQLSTSLEIVPEFADRPHRTSNHQRQTNPALRLHHMMMVCN